MPAVLFDLDGTLHDRATGLRAFASSHAQYLGVIREAQAQFVSRFLELDRNGRVWKDRVYSQLRQEFDSSKWPSTESLVDDYVRDFPRFAVEVPGSMSLLCLLNDQGVRVAILTNGRSDLQRSVIEALGFRPLLNAIIVSEEVGCRKPERQIFEIALASVAATREAAIMVGDDLVADIEGARQAGVYAIAFRCTPPGQVATAENMDSVRTEILKRIRQGPGNGLHRTAASESQG